MHSATKHCSAYNDPTSHPIRTDDCGRPCSNRSPASQASLRKGLTIVEWLLIAFIVLILAGLFLPNVRLSREAARRMQCSNNLKQLGLAFINYEGSFKRLPCAMGGTGIGETALLGNANRLSGFVGMLPYLEHQKLWDTISAPVEFDGVTYPAMGPAPWVASYPPWQSCIPQLRCPSTLGDQSAPGTNYAFCIGDSISDIHVPREPRGAFACGLFTRSDDIRDGTSQTVALVEIGNLAGRATIGQVAVGQSDRLRQNPSLCLQTLSHPRTPTYSKDTALSQFGRGARWVDGSASFGLAATILPPNSPSCAIGEFAAMGDFAVADGVYSAGSQHQRGINVVMADGAVQFVSEDIDSGDSTRPPPFHAQPPTPEQLQQGILRSPYGVWGAMGTANASDQSSE